MENLQDELQRLQEEHTRLSQARSRLTEESAAASEKLAGMERQFPELIVSAALGEISPEALNVFKTELANLRETVREPVTEALKIIEARIRPILNKISGCHERQQMKDYELEYVTARDAIAAKGSYTVLEREKLESLASRCGEGRDCKSFIQAVDQYRSRYAQRNQSEDFPVFEYVPERKE